MKKNMAVVIALAIWGLLGCATSSPTATSTDSPDRGDRELRRGIYWYNKGCNRKALEHFRAAHEHYCIGDRQSGVARSLISLANLYRQAGNVERAKRYYDAAISTARRCDDQTVTAQALSNKAALLIETGEPSAAEVLLDEAQLLSREAGPVFATVLNHRAVLLMNDRQFDAAAGLLDQADAVALGDDSRAGATLRFTRGRLTMRTGDYPKAIDLFQQALFLDRQSGFARGMADDLAALADIHEQLGQDEAALDCLERSIKIYALMNNRDMVLHHLDRLEALAERTGADIRVTLHFIDQWLAGGAIDAICR